MRLPNPMRSRSDQLQYLLREIFPTALPIQVPPGKLGMTPKLGLSYSSSSAKNFSPVGAGWSFGVRSISRSVRNGFPPTKVYEPSAGPFFPPIINPPLNLTLNTSLGSNVSGFSVADSAQTNSSNPCTGTCTIDAGDIDPGIFDWGSTAVDISAVEDSRQRRFGETIVYDNDKSEYESAAGLLVAIVDSDTKVPTYANGKIYAPKREHTPIRFEFLTGDHLCEGGMWVELDPTGFKRYYGCDPDGRRAQVVNELGTHSWLLLMEEDVNGNYISYAYPHPSPHYQTKLFRVPHTTKSFAYYVY